MARKPRVIPKTSKQDRKDTKNSLSKAGLSRFPVTNIKPGSEGKGILGVGLLNERPPLISDFDSKVKTPAGNPLVSPQSVKKYKYF